ncbi:MAG: gamma-glutamyl-gamma-aminobutyrate hydrolase family protein [Hydrogenophilales bacterium]|nr:gamma-glutamyl-gamma-aminobutyrate hydrolase family protein [Hydrogenophilales bacterium]
MKLIAITQRVVVDGAHRERRDALDQRWYAFLNKCGLVPLLIPNHVESAHELISGVPIAGVLFTGGNDLVSMGGDAPERDETEKMLLDWALDQTMPVIGVCRGMQLIQSRFGVALEPVSGHVAETQAITIESEKATVNSFHNYGAYTTSPDLAIFAQASDGVVKGIRHLSYPITAVMWHPERLAPFAERDVAMFQAVFGKAQAGSAKT